VQDLTDVFHRLGQQHQYHDHAPWTHHLEHHSTPTACTVYHPPIYPACVGRSLSTTAVDAYDQLHVVTLSSQPQKVCYSPRSFIVARLATRNSLPASVHDDQLPVTAFCHLLKTVLFSRAHDSLSARLRLFLLSQWANITLTKCCCCCYCYYYNPLH